MGRSMQEKTLDIALSSGQSHENSRAGEHQVTAMETKDKEATMEHREHHDDMTLNNIVYDEDELEPQLRWRSWAVVVAMCLLQFVQLTALVSITTFLTPIATQLHGADKVTWVANGPFIVLVSLSSIIASASDVFQARKKLLLGATVAGLVGSIVVTQSHNIGQLIAGQSLNGLAICSAPLALTVTSEVMPKRWRPMMQGVIAMSAAAGSISGPLIVGGLMAQSATQGWRRFYWLQTGLWAVAGSLILLGYRPPRRHTRLDHLSWLQKLQQLDLIGGILLITGLCLFLAGFTSSGQDGWSDPQVLGPMIPGLVILIGFGLYEWKGTSTGILNHAFFRMGARSRTFVICLYLSFVEGPMSFGYIVYAPLLESVLYTTNPIELSGRSVIFYAGMFLSVLVFGYAASKMKSVREPMLVGFLVYLGAIIGWATLQPDQNATTLALAALLGFGFGSTYGQIVSAAQLVTPHELIATATALTLTFRSLGPALFLPLFNAAVTPRLTKYIPSYIAKAATQAGVPIDLVPALVEALAEGQASSIPNDPSITSSVLAACTRALQQAYADALRWVAIAIAIMVVTAMVACCFLSTTQDLMNYHVDAPVEALHAKKDKKTVDV